MNCLFIGGALYAYGLDKKLKSFLAKLNSENIDKAVVFSTSWISKHSIDLIKKALIDKGIKVEEEYFYAKNKPTDVELKEAENIAKKFTSRIWRCFSSNSKNNKKYKRRIRKSKMVDESWISGYIYYYDCVLYNFILYLENNKL